MQPGKEGQQTKNILKALLFLAIGGLFIWGGTVIWGIPPKSEIRLFYIMKLGIIPIPIPFGVFATPKFWGGLFCLVGGCLSIFNIIEIFKSRH
jgi:hypothetical protein